MIKDTLKKQIKSFPLGDTIALLAGSIVPLAFAPFQYAFLTIIAGAVLFYLWTDVSAKRAMWQGWLFGLGYFGVGVSWLYISIHVYGQTPAIIAMLLTALFISGLAMFFALLGYCYQRYFKASIMAFASLWTVLEYCRSHLFSGFPWLLIGDSQVHSVLKGFLPVVGVYGTTFVTILCAGLLATSILQKKFTSYLSITLFASIFMLGLLLQKVHWTHPDGKSLTVSLIQGNIDQNDKWDPKYFNSIVQTYHQLTMQNFNHDLIIWPETALPTTADIMDDYLKQLDKTAKQKNATVMMGIAVTADHTGNYYNALLSFGGGQGHYYKNHLVPFGEYIPFGKALRPLLNILNIPQGDYLSGGKQQPALRVKDTKVAAYICYEIAYSQLVYQSAQAAQLLLTISDDSWFGHSFAAPQHLQIAQARALATGRFMLFATNNGISAIIDPQGKVLKQAPLFTTLALDAEVSSYTGITPIMRYGNLPIVLMLLLVLSLIRVFAKQARRPTA